MFAFQIWACSGEQKKQSETELLTVIIKQIQKTLSMVCKTQQKGGKKMNNPPSANTALQLVHWVIYTFEVEI